MLPEVKATPSGVNRSAISKSGSSPIPVKLPPDRKGKEEEPKLPETDRLVGAITGVDM